MRIVVTDGHTLNPGDLRWEGLQALGDVVIHDRTPEDLVADRCKSAEVIITNKTVISAGTITGAKKLKLIAVTATGFNIVDLKAADERKIPVCNVPGYGTDSVAQHTFALLLELTNHVGTNAQSVREGAWSRSPDWCYSRLPLSELHGKTLGIVGFGRIGRQVGKIAAAFGMKVIYHDRSEKPGAARKVSMEELFSASDVVSLHCSLKDDNYGFVNARLLSTMKPTAFLINTARGQLINESDLAVALGNKTIAAAALDVLSKEPPPADHPLVGLANCLITPHNAWLSFEARSRIMKTTCRNVEQMLAGNPQNIVNFR
ncbi:MAG TPA: D-2-hydroxyacid dehydrogenase [Ohtaekwangia sp.]|nr:D-2-hydroxyacid dehydrogenase [Ohtaekwangia sp.]